MKKIMKKTLSLVLVFAMLCLPNFAVFAAGPPVGNNMNMDSIAANEEKTITANPGEGYYFTLDTSANYTLSVASSCNEYNVYFYDQIPGNRPGMPINAYNNNMCDRGGNYSISTSALPVQPVCFYIIHYAEAPVEFTVVTEGEAGGVASITGDGSTAEPYNITNSKDNVPALEYGESAYYVVTGLKAGAKYEVTVSTSVQGGSFALYDGNGENPVYSSQMGPGAVVATMTAYAHPASSAVMFMISNTNLGPGGPYAVTVEEVVEVPLGSEEKPDVIEFEVVNVENGILYAEQTSTLTSDQATYYYAWTAEEDGEFTIGFSEELNPNGWEYSVKEVDYTFNGTYSASNYEGADYVNPFKVGVLEGETVVVMVAVLDYVPGTVVFEASFVPGEVVRETEDFVTITTADDISYKMAVAPLIVDDNDVLVSTDEVTLYEFTPSEEDGAGVYKIEVETGYVGYFGSGSTLATTGILTNPNSTVQSVEVTLQANESAILGLTNVDSETAVINVTKVSSINQGGSTEYVDVKIEGPSPEAYTFTGNVDDIEYIDVEDDVVDKVVFSVSDGYYHYGSVSGPVVYVDMDGAYGSINPLVSAENNALKAVDEDGNRWNYSSLYVFYSKVADKETGLYPLNDDLIETFKVAGKNQGWYMAALGGVETEDGWMFNCCYIPAKEVTPEGGSGSGESEKQPEKEPVKVEVPADKVITESVLDEKIEEAVANNAPLVVETTTEGVTLTFAPADLKDAEAVKLNVEVKLDVDVKDETVAKNDDITADNFVLKVEFSHDGKLPAKATIKIPVPAKFANKTLFYYEILADGTLKFVCDAPVDADGNAKVTQDHCSDYVLLTEKVAEAPKTGDNTNFALWIAVLGLGVVAMATSVVMKKREF